ncbi:FecR family protein [Chitinophaga sp.]|uniref:FecR family protein n=1 Tax=Chitinophaga sp. TaxID=1869181 RepID=UPI002BA9FF9B|nr:FecR domain-containing protein [Chitinophaga sp.]HWV66663.1 FecR domain-containing protein [Chitinophaga sp.]
MDQTRFNHLMEMYTAGKLNDHEWQELAGMVMSGEYDQPLHGFIEGVYHTAEHNEALNQEKRQEILDKIYNTETPARKLPVFWWAAASLLLLLASGAAYFYLQPAKTAPILPVQPVVKTRDVQPGTNKAMLTLADGSVVTLDTLGRQELVQGNTAVRQRNGLLQYENRGQDNANSYNTLTTPKGGQYRLLLPDGTAVWLNAGSSLRYPVAFSDAERRVTLTGEAYFEVVHDHKKPFRVQVGNQVVEDLGTRFNINAYADEPVASTTLLEGAVKINNTLLKPGEQAQVTKEGVISVVKNINTADAVAWKEGFFVFRNDNLKTVMRELARWYDVEIIYQPNINNNQQFSGRIDRSLTLAQVLNGLALTKARFTIEDNRKVVILP